MRKDLDREEIPVYSVIVKASSNRNWTPPRGQRSQRNRMALDPSRDPTLQEVRIYLEDINDQPPRFTKLEYTAGTGVRTRPLGGACLAQVWDWCRCVMGRDAILTRLSLYRRSSGR